MEIPEAGRDDSSQNLQAASADSSVFLFCREADLVVDVVNPPSKVGDCFVLNKSTPEKFIFLFICTVWPKQNQVCGSEYKLDKT